MIKKMNFMLEGVLSHLQLSIVPVEIVVMNNWTTRKVRRLTQFFSDILSHSCQFFVARCDKGLLLHYFFDIPGNVFEYVLVGIPQCVLA